MSIGEPRTTETYTYDAEDRLTSITRSDLLAGQYTDVRQYDGAGRVVRTGSQAVAQGWFDATNGEQAGEVRVNRYDGQGRLAYQTVTHADGSPANAISYDAYDGAGNLLQYELSQFGQQNYTNTYQYRIQRLDGYKERAVDGTSTKFTPGSTVEHYDVNGYLVSVNDTTKAGNDRVMVNDAAGMVLYVSQGGHIERELVVDGQFMGRYGVAVDELNPRDNDGNPRFTGVADFTPTYRAIDANYPSASVGAYTVQAGDTLQSIAQAAYGDAQLWWKIAQANGLQSQSDVRVGQTLAIPSATAGARRQRDHPGH